MRERERRGYMILCIRHEYRKEKPKMLLIRSISKYISEK